MPRVDVMVSMVAHFEGNRLTSVFEGHRLISWHRLVVTEPCIADLGRGSGFGVRVRCRP